MAHKKAAGTTKNGRDSGPRYLGIKLTHGDQAKVGSIIVRQKGLDILPGMNVGVGSDHTLFALKEGSVAFKSKRSTKYDNSIIRKKIVSVQ